MYSVHCRLLAIIEDYKQVWSTLHLQNRLHESVYSLSSLLRLFVPDSQTIS